MDFHSYQWISAYSKVNFLDGFPPLPMDSYLFLSEFLSTKKRVYMDFRVFSSGNPSYFSSLSPSIPPTRYPSLKISNWKTSWDPSWNPRFTTFFGQTQSGLLAKIPVGIPGGYPAGIPGESGISVRSIQNI